MKVILEDDGELSEITARYLYWLKRGVSFQLVLPCSLTASLGPSAIVTLPLSVEETLSISV